LLLKLSASGRSQPDARPADYREGPPVARVSLARMGIDSSVNALEDRDMHAIRWFIIIIAEIVALLVVVVCAYLGAKSGETLLLTARFQYGLKADVPSEQAFIIGGIIGFLISALTFFFLVEIAANTRRTALLAERDRSNR
jgi:hypothetical protein